MKIGVVTVYKSENCGSYLQAWAMQTVLNKLGHDALFVPYKKLFERKADIAFQVVKCCLKGRFSTARFLLERRRLFKVAQKKLQICSDAKLLDGCVFGSDTIWNFEDVFFREQYKHFIGEEITCPKVAYAVSAGSTTKECFFSVDGIENALQEFVTIGVRDEHLKEILNMGGIQARITQVVDPTMLIHKDMYEGNPNIRLPKQYVFVYYFGRMGADVYDQLYRFCIERHLEIVHMGFPDDRFQINVTNAPENFISCYQQADYVLTNTFHGCIFSILFNKRFATDGYVKKKVDNLIKEFGLETQCLSSKQSLQSCFDYDTQYDRVNKKLDLLRMKSLEFLTNSINDVMQNEDK